jgi:hypothetical protein
MAVQEVAVTEHLLTMEFILETAFQTLVVVVVVDLVMHPTATLTILVAPVVHRQAMAAQEW